MEKIWAK